MAQTWLYWVIPTIITIVVIIISCLVYRFRLKQKKAAAALGDIVFDPLKGDIVFDPLATGFNPLATGYPGPPDCFGNEIYSRQQRQQNRAGKVKGYPEIMLPTQNVNELNISSVASSAFIHPLILLTSGYIKRCKLNNKNIGIKTLTLIIVNYQFSLSEYLKELHYAFNNPSDEITKKYKNKSILRDINSMDCQLFSVLIKHSTKPPAEEPFKSNNDIQIISYILKKYAHHKIRKIKAKAKDINYIFFDEGFNFNFIVFDSEDEGRYTTPTMYTSTTYRETSLTEIGKNISTLTEPQDNGPVAFIDDKGINYFDYLKDIVLLKLNQRIEKSVSGIYHGKYKKNVLNECASHNTNYEYIVISLNKERNSNFNIDEYIVWSGVVGWSNMHFARDYGSSRY